MAIGYQAGQAGQTIYGVAIGHGAGATSQGNNSVAIGYQACNLGQGNNSVAIGVNASKIKSEVLSLSDGATRLQTGLATADVGVCAQVGQSFPSLYGTAYTRDDEGHIMLNANGDPIVSSELKYLGTTTPTLIMGFNTSVRYKQFTLSAVADYKTGHKYYNNLVDALEFTGSTQHSASAGREPFVFPNSVYEYTPGVWSENTNITTSNGDRKSVV